MRNDHIWLDRSKCSKTRSRWNYTCKPSRPGWQVWETRAMLTYWEQMLLWHCCSFWDKLCFRQNPSFTAVSVTFHTDRHWLHEKQICPSHFGVSFTEKLRTWVTILVYISQMKLAHTPFTQLNYSEWVLVLLHESLLKLYTKQQRVHSIMQAKFKTQPTSDCNNKKKMEWRNSNFWLNWYKLVTFRLTADLVFLS